MKKNKAESRITELNELLKSSNITLQYFEKPENNQNFKIGYSVQEGESIFCPIFYYDQYMDDLCDRQLAGMIVEFFEKTRLETKEISKWVQLDRERLLSAVQPRLLNASNLAAFSQKGYALKVLGNFIVLFYVPLCKDDESTASIGITDTILNYFSISLEEIYDHAIENIGAYADLRPLDDAIVNILNSYEIEVSKEDPVLYAIPEIIVLSNVDNTNGAAVILNRDVLSRVHEIFYGHPYYLLPSSVHEMLAIDSNNIIASVLQDMLISVNHDVLQSEEYLSDLILYCDSCQLYELDCRNQPENHKLEADAIPLQV